MSFKRYRGPDIKEQIIRNKMRRLSKRLDLVACDYRYVLTMKRRRGLEIQFIDIQIKMRKLREQLNDVVSSY